MQGLEGVGSHLDLFFGLPVSPSSCVACLVLLGAWLGLTWLRAGMGEVLVEMESPSLLPALLHVLGAAAVTVAVTATPSVGSAAASPSLGVPERSTVHIWVFLVGFGYLGFIGFVPWTRGRKKFQMSGWSDLGTGPLGLLPILGVLVVP